MSASPTGTNASELRPHWRNSPQFPNIPVTVNASLEDSAGSARFCPCDFTAETRFTAARPILFWVPRVPDGPDCRCSSAWPPRADNTCSAETPWQRGRPGGEHCSLGRAEAPIHWCKPRRHPTGHQNIRCIGPYKSRQTRTHSASTAVCQDDPNPTLLRRNTLWSH